MSFNIKDSDLTMTCPVALTYDPKQYAFVKALAVGLHASLQLVDVAGIYYRIDDLQESMLDILATDLGISGYDSSYPIENKIEIIKASMYSNNHPGTPAGFERSVGAFLGENTRIHEWFDYGGEPYHFYLTDADPLALYGSDKIYSKVIEHINSVKRVSTRMDSISCTDISILDLDGIYLLDENGDYLCDENDNRLMA